MCFGEAGGRAGWRAGVSHICCLRVLGGSGLGFYSPLYLQTAKPCDRRWDFSQSMADTYFGALTVRQHGCNTICIGLPSVLLGGE